MDFISRPLTLSDASYPFSESIRHLFLGGFISLADAFRLSAGGYFDVFSIDVPTIPDDFVFMGRDYGARLLVRDSAAKDLLVETLRLVEGDVEVDCMPSDLIHVGYGPFDLVSTGKFLPTALSRVERILLTSYDVKFYAVRGYSLFDF